MNKTTVNIDNISFDIYSDNIVFGDGTHESTQEVLELMSKYDFENKTVIDIGTGTGILSIFAKLKEANHVLALDIFPTALEYARKNAKRNNVEIDFEINNLTEYINDKADIILANLPPTEQCENNKKEFK